MESSALKMLAEVASATLENDPSLFCYMNETMNVCSNSRVNNNPTRRSASNSERLTLDQIRGLSDKMLIDMFSELICDEIRKNYSFKCFLVPEKCSQIFKSFGSEARARCKMLAHLQSHITDLESEYNATTGSPFTSEPLYVRRKRQELHVKSVRKKKKSKQTKTKSKRDSSMEMCFNDDVGDLNFEPRNIAFQNNYSSSANSFSYDFGMYDSLSINQSAGVTPNMHLPVCQENSSSSMQEYNFKSYYENQATNVITSPDNLSPKLLTRRKTKQESISSNSAQLHYDVKWNVDFDTAYLSNSSHSNCYMGKNYPSSFMSIHHDHTYTSANGFFHYDISSEEYGSSFNARRGSQSQLDSDRQIIIPTPAFPYVYSPMLPYIAEMREIGNVAHSTGRWDLNSKSALGRSMVPSNKPLRKAKEKDLQNINHDFSLSKDELIDDENSPSDSLMDDVVLQNETFNESNTNSVHDSTCVVGDILEKDCPTNLQSVDKTQ